jgi:hypothetical protein
MEDRAFEHSKHFLDYRVIRTNPTQGLEIYPSAMNNADLYDVSHESDDSFESNSDRIFRFNWWRHQSNQVRVALFL